MRYLVILLLSLSGLAQSQANGLQACIEDNNCGNDQACIDEATKMAKDWVTTYKDAMGGDKAKAEEHMNGIIECSPAVALGFAAAAE